MSRVLSENLPLSEFAANATIEKNYSEFEAYECLNFQLRNCLEGLRLGA